MKRRVRIGALVLAAVMITCVLAGCSKKSDTITIGSKQFTENYLLGEVYAQLIEAHTDLKVERKLYLGGTSVLYPAMQNKELDVYVEYSGTIYGEYLKLGSSSHLTANEVYNIAKDGLDELGITMFTPIGINNTYALGLLKTTADSLGIKTMSDLAAHAPELNFGGNHLFFERESDGYDSMVDVYGYNFKSVQKMDTSLLYEAIDQGQLDVIVIYATDSLLVKYDMAILEDDLQLFPAYHGAPIIRTEVLEAHPELSEVLDMLAGLVSDQLMQQLDYQVDVENKSIESVATQFLTDNGLL